MSKNIRKANQHSLKVVRRFEEDIWGRLAISDKDSKALDYIFNIYKNDFRYRSLIGNKRFFLVSKKAKFLYQVSANEKEFKRKKRTMKIKNYLNRQKFRRFYGNISEKSLKKVFNQYSLTTNKLGSFFFNFLEGRLDVVVYRSNFADSIFAVRQLISHKKILVNGKVVNIPSYKLNVGDIITLADPALLYQYMKNKLEKKKVLANYPSYLEVNYMLGAIIFIRFPKKEEIPYPFFLDRSELIQSFSK